MMGLFTGPPLTLQPLVVWGSQKQYSDFSEKSIMF
uniref:Uncharacterized protein n=1 Tax=Anguilla anguilla TaxID=7936 RepID=A0A0E9QSE0_ANGAN